MLTPYGLLLAQIKINRATYMSIKKLFSPTKAKVSADDTQVEHHFVFHLDTSCNHVVRGWAYDEANPSAPVHIAFKEGDRLFCEVMADQPREDLAQAGLPTSNCAFETCPDLPQHTLAPTLADMYINDVKVNTTPVTFAMSIDVLVEVIKTELLKKTRVR